MAISTRIGGGVGTPTPIPTNTSTPSPIPSPTPTYSSEVTWESDNLNHSNVDFSSDAYAYGGQENTTWKETTEHSSENTRYFDASNDVYTYDNDDYFDASSEVVSATENTSTSTSSDPSFVSQQQIHFVPPPNFDQSFTDDYSISFTTDNVSAPQEHQQNAGVNRSNEHPVSEGSGVPIAADSVPFSFGSFDDIFVTQTPSTDTSSSHQYNDNSLSDVPTSSPVSAASSSADTQGVGDIQNNLTAEIVAQRIADLERHFGHTLARHGGPNRVTDQQLEDRVMRGIDPASGTTSDAFVRGPNRSATSHMVGRHATAFASDEALVKADLYFRASSQLDQALNDARSSGYRLLDPISAPLEDIFGSDYRDEVRGVTRLGPRETPTGHRSTDFTDGQVKAFYRIGRNGDVEPKSMYPDVKPR